MRPNNSSDRVPIFDRVVASFDSRGTAILAILLSGAVAGALEFVTHLAVAKMGPGLQFHAGVDATVICLLTMTLVTVIIVAARARRRQVLKEMEKIAELNHHVRNALQVIRDSHLLPEDRQAQAVIESVERIDRTLRHLFPPSTTEYDKRKAEILQSIAAESQSQEESQQAD